MTSRNTRLSGIPRLPALLAAALALPAAAWAQQADQAESALPRYRVELLIFENLSPVASDEDRGRVALPPPPPETPVDAPPGTPLEQPGRSPSVEAPSDQVPPQAPFFQPAATGELADLHGRLARSAAYRPLAWVAWEQPGFPREQARSIDLTRLLQLARAAASGAGTDEALEGEISLWLSRYLHLDLALRQGPAEAPVARLNQQRRMRSRTLHYFDAPRLGAIAVIVPVEEPAPRVGETPQFPGSAPDS